MQVTQHFKLFSLELQKFSVCEFTTKDYAVEAISSVKKVLICLNI